MRIEVEGRVALVTGGSRGIGLGIARRFCEAGGDVMLVSRRAENLEPAAASLAGLRGGVAWTVGHVGRPEAAEAAVAATIERFGSLDVLVNNAGTNPYMGPLLGIDDVRLQKTYEINQASVVTWSRAAWHQWMAQHGGAILNVASIGGLGAEPRIGWYNATKAAVIHLTRQLALELAPTVRVNGLAPGLVRTELARGLWEGNEERIAKTLPLGRIGEVDDVAPMALLLVSDAASWITGQTVVVDGGTTTRSSGGVV
ncbi:MAG TPA: SDR family oxidoreductase [Acidimicrobiales bacterium]|jgi:NAD(P)-dependent dehydrogenase (short-subunit alcohol dehydrogenase family)|nr:SDR family oxidoreductase [Acidimicrobiales bacterium]